MSSDRTSTPLENYFLTRENKVEELVVYSPGHPAKRDGVHMNSVSVIGGSRAGWPVVRPFPDVAVVSLCRAASLMARHAHRVAIVAMASLVAGAEASRARTSRITAASPAPVAMERLGAVPRNGSRTEADMMGRFQREMVPQLDAAYNFARFLSRDADAAQDIVQEAFLRAYRSFEGYQGGDARAWIFTIVRNCYHNWLQQRRRKSRIEVDAGPLSDEGPELDVAADDDTPEVSLLRRSESLAVRVVLNRLPRGLREMLVLRELEGMSYREIADIAALPIGTVMSRLARARQQFQQAWQLYSDQQETGT